MTRKIWIYLAFFAVLLIAFYLMIPREMLSKPVLPVINPSVADFHFTDQNGKALTERDVDGKVYVANYFFTTCRGICPRMNGNMRRVFDAFKDEDNFLIISHTCMPETDSTPLLKAYEARMVNGTLVRGADGSSEVEYDTNAMRNKPVANRNWFFVTGDKAALYRMARQSYLIDNNRPDSLQNISDQFIHTQFFALVDKNRRVRAIYDGLKNDEVEKLISDIREILKEKVTTKRFMDGFNNNPN